MSTSWKTCGTAVDHARRESEPPAFHTFFTADFEQPWKPDPDLTSEEKTMRINNLAAITRNMQKEAGL